MRVIIIEDEFPATEKLERYILKYDNAIEIVARLSSIAEATTWLKSTDNAYDLAFMDIQLTDGLSFEIFSQVKLSKPVIFTTAFDEFAIDAFKVNSIDYILKPITFTDVSTALTKYKNLKENYASNQNIGDIVKTITEKKTKERFLVRLGNHIHSIKTNEISMFFAEGRTVFLVTNQNKKYILDYKLEDLHDILDESNFFRVNRTFIININAIKDVVIYSNSRLKVELLINAEKDIIVSREKVTVFKNWFEGN